MAIRSAPYFLATSSSDWDFSRCCHSGVRLPGRARGISSARAAFSRKRAPNRADEPGYIVGDAHSVHHSADPFCYPTGIESGAEEDIWVTDGYGNARVHHFNSTGDLIGSFGNPGSGPLEFVIPHGVLRRPTGELLVSDRVNERLQVIDPRGVMVDCWPGLHFPNNIATTDHEVYYVAELGNFVQGLPQETTIVPEAPYARVTVRDSSGALLAEILPAPGLPRDTWFAPHVWPHAPQFCKSLAVSTQAPWHEVPRRHTQAPSLQVAPFLHTTPHAPQFVESEGNGTHAPAHGVSPAAQEVEHDPMSQTSFRAQLVPQAPQWAIFERSSTQAPPQDAWPSGHVHTPPLQIWSAAQATPQAPQLAGSLVVDLHSDPQRVVPSAQPRAAQPLAQAEGTAPELGNTKTLSVEPPSPTTGLKEIDPHGLLFGKVKADLQGFLESLGNQLYNNPAEAVNVGPSVNTPETIKERKVVAEVAVKPTKAAEEVILRLSAHA